VLKKTIWALVVLVALAGVALFVLLQRADTEFLVLDEEARELAPGLFVELSDGWTHYDVAGPESGQVVILVHGFSVPYYIWDSTFEALAAAGFRVIRFDLFGRGYSDRPATDYDGALYERQVGDLIDALELERPVDLIGLSMGGAVVMRFAANQSELVRKIVLVDPMTEASSPPQYPQWIGSPLIALTLIPVMAEGQLTDFLQPEKYPTWVEQYRVQMQYEGFRRAITSTIYAFAPEDHLSNYRQVQESGLPVKLIWGVQDQTLSIDGAKTVQSVLDVDFLAVDNAGHLPHIEQAAIVNPAIVEFLKGDAQAAAKSGAELVANLELASFCSRLPRAGYKDLDKSDFSNEWFEVYELDDGVWAIYEPFQWQEVISYLIIGEESALLFDTGNGIGDIRAIVDQLTDKPVRVLNSHSHFDHIGGNYQFENILSPSTAFSIEKALGDDSDSVKMEASADALCVDLPAGVTASSHHIEPYSITSRVRDGDMIDLGGRELEVILTPGHTDDSVALLDKKAGLLWTGDSFYAGPIWLFFPETDLAAYEQSIDRLLVLVPGLKALLPAHNIPMIDPAKLLEIQRALKLILEGKAEAIPDRDGLLMFEFDGFGFLMREDYTTVAGD
jgi:pimeloyl-ACP methyl ester carboxylesterase/glyoxylase-like metal-dependent hydrolase (beta-lactamase superfamily II)